MKKSFRTMIALIAVAVAVTLGVMACAKTAASPAIVWIDLFGPAPTGTEGADTFSATLSLDFSEPIPELDASLTSARLNEIFTFAYYKEGNKVPAYINAIEVTPDKMSAGNIYNLEVRGVPKEGGRVDVTIATLAVEPLMRPWYLDGHHTNAAKGTAKRSPTATAPFSGKESYKEDGT
jgi:hypothetical protein